MNGANRNELVPAPALAKELGVHRRTLARWINDEELAFPPATVIRNRLYFPRDAVEAWKAARLRQSIAEAA